MNKNKLFLGIFSAVITIIFVFIFSTNQPETAEAGRKPKPTPIPTASPTRIPTATPTTTATPSATID